MEINTTREGDLSIVDLEGKFDFASSRPVEIRLLELVEEGAHRLVLNLSGVQYIASSGMRVLLKVAQQVQGHGGKLCACCPNETVAEVIELSGFDRILDVFETRQDALDAFS